MAQGGRYQNNAIILGGNTFANLGLFEEKVTTFLTFPLKIPTLHTHYPRIIALLQSRPPCASPGHSWGGRGYLFRNFVFLNLTF